MNKKMKKIVATIAIAGMLSSGAIFAEYNPEKVLDPTNPVPTTDGLLLTKPTKATMKITVDGKDIKATPYTSGDVVMIPLRAVSEALGYKVGWEEDSLRITLTQGPHYITATPAKDEYTFAKMGPMKLGKAPETVNDTTYVPSNFVSEVLMRNIVIGQDGVIAITDEEPKAEDDVISATPIENSFVKVEVTDIKVDDKDKRTDLVVKDAKLGEVIVHISDKTIIKNGEKDAKFADIKKGDTVFVKYSPAMTASLPPQTSAIEVNIGELTAEVAPEVDEMKAVKVIVNSIDKENKSINVQDDSRGKGREGQVNVNITKETKLTDGDEKANFEDIEKGDEILVTYGMAMTFSIPPMTNAVAINLEVNEKEDDDDKDKVADSIKFEGEIKEIDGEKVIVDVEDSDMDVALIITKDTVLKHEKQKIVVTAKDLKVGMEIEGSHSPMMTRSIPPQTVAFTVIIAD